MCVCVCRWIYWVFKCFFFNFFSFWQKRLWELCCARSSYLLWCGQTDVSQLWEVKMWSILVLLSVCIHSRLQSQAERITSVFKFRKKAERSKKFFIDLQAKEHVMTMVNPKPCGHLCCCVIKGCEQVGGVSQSSCTTIDFKAKSLMEDSSSTHETTFHFISNGSPWRLNNLWDELPKVSI